MQTNVKDDNSLEMQNWWAGVNFAVSNKVIDGLLQRHLQHILFPDIQFHEISPIILRCLFF